MSEISLSKCQNFIHLYNKAFRSIYILMLALARQTAGSNGLDIFRGIRWIPRG